MDLLIKSEIFKTFIKNLQGLEWTWYQFESSWLYIRELAKQGTGTQLCLN